MRSPSRLPTVVGQAARAITITIRNVDKRIGTRVFTKVLQFGSYPQGRMSRERKSLGSDRVVT
jgi:hypothetical protein